MWTQAVVDERDRRQMSTRDWMYDSSQVSRWMLSVKPEVLARMYSPRKLAYVREVATLKQRALRASRTRTPMTPPVQAAWRYLQRYAEIHQRWWRHSCEAEFYAAMKEARRRLAADLGRYDMLEVDEAEAERVPA